MHISIGLGGKKRKRGCDIIFWVPVQIQVGRGWRERRGVFPPRESPNPSRESSTIYQIIDRCAMSFEWHHLIKADIYIFNFCTGIFQRAELLTFCYVFRLFSRKGIFCLLSTQSNYLRFYGISASTSTYEGRCFRTLKTRVVNHQNNPCLLPKHPPPGVPYL